MKVEQAIRRFERSLKANGYSHHTIRAYRCDLEGLVRFCDERRLRLQCLDANHISSFLTSPHALNGPTGRQRAPGAVNRVRASLRAFFGWLCDTGQIRANPAASLRVRSLPQRLPRVLSRGEQRRLLSVLRGHEDPLAFRDRVMVEMLLATGIRVGELVGLTVQAVDVAARTATIRTKGGAHQVRHIRRDVAKLLRRYLRWRLGSPNGSSALFVSAAGQAIGVRHFQRRLKQWLGQADIDGQVSAHTFRHTLATRLLSATGNLRLVQQALGHRSIASTIRYAHVPSAQLISALEAV